MENTISIKNKLSATQDTKKITQSLQLVAANKMKQFARKALASKDFTKTLLGSLGVLLKDNDTESVFTTKRESGSVLFILVASDRGLCGSLNQKVFKSLLESDLWKQEDKKLITVGQKAADFARRVGVSPVESFTGLGDNLTMLSSLKIINSIFSYWLSGMVREVYIVFPEYISPFVNTPSIRNFLPFSLEMAKVEATTTSYDVPIVEPDSQTVINKLSRQVVSQLFYNAFLEMKASEYSSRMIAMDKATKAAQDMIEALNLEFNKARQAKITAQVSELAAAVDATK